ncbi:MAG: hypothetical protein K2Y29_17915 [Beijerinckiaceae bacterium]|nr:hypothetical protein [Beijerinckiaceae bacterium]
MNNSPEWHAEVKELRAGGMHPVEIARTVGKSITAVRWVLDENGEREATRERVRRGRNKVVGKVRQVAARKSPARIDTLALARLFAAGQIDRSELSRRLRGEEVSA